MPHDQNVGGRSYFSEFTALSVIGTIHRAKSNEQLSRHWKSKQAKSSLFSPDFSQHLQKAKSTQDLRKQDRRLGKLVASHISAAEETDPSLRLEFERELEEQLQKLERRAKYNAVTVPSSVKYSVTGDAPNKQPQLSFTSPSNSSTMSRPRSPKSREPQRMEGLDQLIYNIRQQLVSEKFAKMYPLG